MSSFVITGSDTITLAGRLFTNLSTGDVGKIAFDGDLASIATGKGGNSVIAPDEQGRQGTMTLRLLRGSSDDKFLMALLNQWLLFPPSFILMSGTLVKLIGRGNGIITPDTYICQGGIFTKIPEVVSNVNGDTDQGQTEYTMKFAKVTRNVF